MKIFLSNITLRAVNTANKKNIYIILDIYFIHFILFYFIIEAIKL